MSGNKIFEKGQKVTYKTEFENEKGIVKSMSGPDHAFVVYHCNNDWDNYEDYTGARTKLIDLEEGWGDK